MERKKKRPSKLHVAYLPIACGVLISVHDVSANTLSDNAAQLKNLSLEELMNVEVQSVSRRPEKLTQAASAIQVISQEDIHRSAATSIPEALRLAPNLQVAQVNASQWAISARGFDNVLANKLLVMIDGRTVYTPLYGGVFWDVQNTLLEDVDQIEVVSGPGGTLWGANAVNGVINITTKAASKTQGLYVSGAAGDELNSYGEFRYGGELGQDVSYRVYAKSVSYDDTKLLNGNDANDAWHTKQGGLRFDWDMANGALTLQSDFYESDPNPDGATPVDASGGNLMTRWRHVISPDSDLQLQFYYDKTKRDFNNGFVENLATYDLDWQHRFRLDAYHQEVVWGASIRLMDHQVNNLALFAFLPPQKTLHLYSAFVQDEIGMLDEQLRLTLGIKLERNDYTGVESQPNIRLAWSPTATQTIWSAVSRAVRTPARIDRDFYLFATPTFPVIQGADLQSEELTAYELGWRSVPQDNLSLSVSTFFNDYDNIRSAEPGPPPFNLPITFANGVQGQTYGVELATTYTVMSNWQLRGGYTFLKKHLSIKPDSKDLNGGTAESNDPEHQVVLRSLLDLPLQLQLDTVVRYVDSLPTPHVESHIDLDVRLAWRAAHNLELSIVGQNLLNASHQEFIPTSPAPREIERSLYGKITWQL
jgi:iron complex outermembrane recepter protein